MKNFFSQKSIIALAVVGFFFLNNLLPDQIEENNTRREDTSACIEQPNIPKKSQGPLIKIIINGTSAAGKTVVAQHLSILLSNDKDHQKNRYAILDTAIFSLSEMAEYIGTDNALTVLLYCPLTILPYHILEYNRSCSPLKDQKSLKNALNQFFSLYYSVPINNNTVIGTVTQRDLNTIFEYRESIYFPSMKAAAIDDYMNFTTQIFKIHFRLYEKTKEIYLAPIINHAITLNSGTSSPEECALMIKQALESLLTRTKTPTE